MDENAVTSLAQLPLIDLCLFLFYSVTEVQISVRPNSRALKMNTKAAG